MTLAPLFDVPLTTGSSSSAGVVAPEGGAEGAEGGAADGVSGRRSSASPTNTTPSGSTAPYATPSTTAVSQRRADPSGNS